ncbi:CRISPR-associated protein Cse4 [Synechococcus sp. 65AY6Li]|jgi:CRISPR system Cascade subunit CasC|uniref:type I-E CRISPR-associated protein Cas7/Cse4/CasC n=1 Tax=unclassified Synechococcus TaxID=2626047 RepID=UPI000069416F|nr:MULTISPECIES: type I-E CRISPR-associated protein Cas7/Cse4/CasC [unclassified Synechococcus]ABC98944.1 CRISPR-associated protein, Cse4 family [Synechococcus sp. JA-3-3Ab]PIK90979.1 CRISPR-associated protein Cse4 [Synechococcus sp. 65AY6Li]
MRLEIHLIQSFPPANLNRDENGMPKSTIFGGRPRARISSQCQKRAVRKYYHQYAELDPAHFAARSRNWLPELKSKLVKAGIPDEQAGMAARLALEQGLKLKFNDKNEATTIVFLGKTELDAIAEILIKNWSAIESGLREEKPKLPQKIAKAIEKALVDTGKPGDVALFGRMMASLPTVNVDAAVQVAHAISINALQQEFDFFTAVDDLGSSEDTGADHMGETGYNSSTYYRFAVLDKKQLVENLGGTEHLGSIIKAFATAFIHAVPSGHQNGFAAHTRPALVMAVVREGQPISLVDAFENPVAPSGGFSLLENAVKALDEYWGSLVKMYGEADVQYKGVVVLDRLAARLNVLKSSKKDSVEELLKSALKAFGVASNGQGA